MKYFPQWKALTGITVILMKLFEVLFRPGGVEVKHMQGSKISR